MSTDQAILHILDVFLDEVRPRSVVTPPNSVHGVWAAKYSTREDGTLVSVSLLPISESICACEVSVSSTAPTEDLWEQYAAGDANAAERHSRYTESVRHAIDALGSPLRSSNLGRSARSMDDMRMRIEVSERAEAVKYHYPHCPSVAFLSQMELLDETLLIIADIIASTVSELYGTVWQTFEHLRASEAHDMFALSTDYCSHNGVQLARSYWSRVVPMSSPQVVKFSVIDAETLVGELRCSEWSAPATVRVIPGLRRRRNLPAVQPGLHTGRVVFDLVPLPAVPVLDLMDQGLDVGTGVGARSGV